MNISNRETLWGRPQVPWPKRDATLNWLALGLLLAAWNAADDAGAVRRRPQSLRAYSFVTVRAVTRCAIAPGDRLGAALLSRNVRFLNKGHKSVNEL